MTPSREDRERAVWKDALAPLPECIPIQRFASPLADAESQHLATCPRCQAEMALWREFHDSIPRGEEGAAAAWIAQELRRRAAAPKRWRPWWRPLMAVPAGRLSGALAAVLVLAAGLTMYTLRSPTGLPPRLSSEGPLRSQAVVLLFPLGDLEARPGELQWQPVAAATAYRVEILEVDRHSLWNSETVQTHLAIPESIRTLMAPGKTLLWQVTARDRSQVLASSGLQRFRLKVKRIGGGEL